MRNDRAKHQSVTRRPLMTEAQTVPTRVGEEAGANHRDPAGPGPEYISCSCVSRLHDFCQFYKLTLSNQAQFTLLLTVSLLYLL